MKTIGEISNITGLSIRTLRYYDEIGLLKPDEVTQAGYRLYNEEAESRIQSILLFRELRFSLKEIAEILDSPDFDLKKAIDDRIKLLEIEKKRIDELISYAREIQKKGAKNVKFESLENEKEAYRTEARARWGETKAYKEYLEKENGGQSLGERAEKLMILFAKAGKLREKSPDNSEVQKIIREIQSFITENFYTCTKEMFAGLGSMYASDERFKKNIDKYGGSGTAEFVSRAIEIYCADN